jgi:Ca2+-binding EF-hand superfamily protein
MASTKKSLSRVMFDKYDVDGSGFIDAEEFQRMLLGQGIYLSEEGAKVALKQIDHNVRRDYIFMMIDKLSLS